MHDFTTTTTTTVLRPFSRDYPGEPVPEEEIFSWTLGLYGAREDNRGRHTDHPDGRYSIRTNQPPTSVPHFTQDALPAATLLLYPGLGQALNMLDCIMHDFRLLQLVLYVICNAYFDILPARRPNFYMSLTVTSVVQFPRDR